MLNLVYFQGVIILCFKYINFTWSPFVYKLWTVDCTVSNHLLIAYLVQAGAEMLHVICRNPCIINPRCRMSHCPAFIWLYTEIPKVSNEMQWYQENDWVNLVIYLLCLLSESSIQASIISGELLPFNICNNISPTVATLLKTLFIFIKLNDLCCVFFVSHMHYYY